MAYINKNVSTMAMPSGMNRMGQFPLDMSSVYYDLESLQAYATSGAVAYVGQILSLVDETNNNVTLYAIKNTAGDLVEIAADIVMPEIPEVPEYSGEGAINVADYKISVVVDDETIKIVDGKLTAIIPEVEIPDITASDDDVVILTAEGHAVSAAHAKKGPEGGATKGAAADAEVNAFGSSIEFKVPAVTVDEYGHTTALDEKTIKVSIPNAPADNDTKTAVESGDNYIVVDGSLTENASNVFTVKINEATLKALIGSETTAAMEFKGATASLPENAQKGDVYKVTATFIVDAENNAESDDADPSGFVTEIGDSIVAEGNGKWYLIPSGDDIEDTWRPVTNVDNSSTLTFSAGSKLVAEVKADGSITYSHEAIAAPGLVEGGSGRTYITELVSDGFGHITGYKVATESVVDTNDNDTYSAGNGIEISDDGDEAHTVSIKLADNETHLQVNENGLSIDLSDVDTDTTYTLSANNTTIILTPSEGEAQEVTLDVYTKGQTDQAIADKINEVNGGESAGEVLSNLNAYKKNIDTEIWGSDKVGAWTGEDGKYNPDYTEASRIDDLITSVTNLEEALNDKINKDDVSETQFEWVDNKLTIKSIDVAVVANLENLLNEKADKTTVNSLSELVNEIDGKVTDLTTALDNYVLKSDYQIVESDVALLKEAMTWGFME